MHALIAAPRPQVAPPPAETWVVAFSMFGNDRRYIDGTHINAHLVKALFPGWTMRLYHDRSVDSSLLADLKRLRVDLKDMTDERLSNRMTWRFTVAADETVRFLSTVSFKLTVHAHTHSRTHIPSLCPLAFLFHASQTQSIATK